MAAHKIAVFSFSKKAGLIAEADREINCLSELLDNRYGISLPIEIVNGHSNCAEVVDKISAICEMYEQNHRFADLLHMVYLTCYPAKYTQYQGLTASAKAMLESVKFSCGQAVKDGEKVLVFNDFRIKEGGLWGSNWEELSWVNKFCKEVIWHEVLHLFGVGEGYDSKSKKNHTWCERGKCWMQYEATQGKGLCGCHQRQLKQFLEKKTA